MKGFNMKKTLYVLCTAAFCCSVSAESVVYRDPSDGRAWAVFADVSEPVTWMWADGAVSATLTASNLLTRASASVTVQRGGSPDGSCVIPLAIDGQQLLDVVLTQSDGSSVVEERTVRLSAGSVSTVYTDATDNDFKAISEPRVYAWSDKWDDQSSSAASATLSTAVKGGAAIGFWNLPSTGGFGLLSPKESFSNSPDTVTATVAFDGTGYLTCELNIRRLALTITFK